MGNYENFKKLELVKIQKKVYFQKIRITKIEFLENFNLYRYIFRKNCIQKIYKKIQNNKKNFW